MLQKLNERIQGLVAWIIIILVTITFMLFGLDYYMQSRHESSAEVDVNGQPITKQAFELNYRRNRQLRDSSNMTAVNENQLKQKLLDEMIINQVSMQSARANGFEVYPGQANSAIVSIPQFQEEGHFSNARYQQALSSAMYTPESFQKEVRQGMLLNQQRFAFIGTDFALPGEVKQFVKLYMQTRDYDYLQIPSRHFLKPTSVTQSEINTYYQQHLQDFLSSEQVSLDYIRLTLKDVKSKIAITDGEIRQYYDENQAELGRKPLSDVKDEIKTQLLADLAQAKYAQILEELADQSYQTPDSLDQVATSLHLEVEQSELFSRDGGETVLTKNKQVLQAAFSHDVLTLGNNSEPIQFDKDGVVVLRVHTHILAKEKPLVDVSGFIAEKLAEEKASLTAAQFGKVLLDGNQTVLLQEKLMTDHKLHWHAVVNANRDMDAVPVAINELAFNLQHEDAKDGVSLADGDYVIVRLKKINNGKLKSVDKEQISSITQQIEANNGVMDYQLYINDLMSKAHIVKHPA